jgi:hypothetical protein
MFAHCGWWEVEQDYVMAHGGKRPIRKILVANNGMAAAKCILSMRRWAYMALGDESLLRFVAMATPEDLNANAEFIRQVSPFTPPHSHSTALPSLALEVLLRPSTRMLGMANLEYLSTLVPRPLLKPYLPIAKIGGKIGGRISPLF